MHDALVVRGGGTGIRPWWVGFDAAQVIPQCPRGDWLFWRGLRGCAHGFEACCQVVVPEVCWSTRPSRVRASSASLTVVLAAARVHTPTHKPSDRVPKHSCRRAQIAARLLGSRFPNAGAMSG